MLGGGFSTAEGGADRRRAQGFDVAFGDVSDPKTLAPLPADEDELVVDYAPWLGIQTPTQARRFQVTRSPPTRRKLVRDA